MLKLILRLIVWSVFFILLAWLIISYNLFPQAYHTDVDIAYVVLVIVGLIDIARAALHIGADTGISRFRATQAARARSQSTDVAFQDDRLNGR